MLQGDWNNDLSKTNFTYNLFKKEKIILMKNESRAAEKPLFEINNYFAYKKKEKRIKVSWNEFFFFTFVKCAA